MLNSFSVFLWNDFVIVPISLFCAFILYKKMPLGGAFKVIFFLPSIISVVVLTLAYRFMFDASFGFIPELLESIGLGDKVPFDGYFADKNYAWWMILLYGLWSGIGYNIVLVSGAMARIPEEIIEAGKLDGLSTFRELFSVTIPLIGPTLGTLLLLGTTVIFTYFLQPQLLLGDNAATDGRLYDRAVYRHARQERRNGADGAGRHDRNSVRAGRHAHRVPLPQGDRQNVARLRILVKIYGGHP